MSSIRRHLTLVAAALALTASLAPAAAAQPPPPPSADSVDAYRVDGIDTPAERAALSRSGVDVTGGRGSTYEVRATPQQVADLARRGLGVTPLASGPASADRTFAAAAGFPAGYTGYHDFAELNSELAALAAAFPTTVRVSDYGRSYQGRTLPLVKISSNAAVDQALPEVLFTCGQHAREHLTIEMCLRIAQRLAANPALYAGREVWIVPNANPDGAEYDIATGSFVSWRKNRQPNTNGTVGTDLNRNWGYRWGCCGGSSGTPGSDTYRGTAAFSGVEAARIRDFVQSRVVGGRQQIRAHIDWHTYSELVLWPYGYTFADTATGLSRADERAFRALGQQMAATNGYTPQQSSDLYIADGTINDWMWGAYRIWSYTFEMAPQSQAQGGFYPPDTVIPRETARNDAAVDLFLSYADCVPRIVGGTCAA